ncbi:MAG: acyltransferase [Bacteroidetes bacterium]|nr:acyltransferase [Bacteroidota bacterium]
MLAVFPYFRIFKATRNYEYPVTLSVWWRQKCLGKNGDAYWPMHPSSMVSYPKNVLVGKGVVPGYSAGCYIHAVNKIYIDDYSFIAPNVGIMSGNHDVADLRLQTPGNPVRIGKYCWIGMNAMILPGVTLGDFTIVGAGAVVTKSFDEGYCVIAGNPAKVIKILSKENCLRYEENIRYIGYIREDKFEEFRKKNLNI